MTMITQWKSRCRCNQTDKSVTSNGRKVPATPSGTNRSGRPLPPSKTWILPHRQIFRLTSTFALTSRKKPNPSRNDAKKNFPLASRFIERTEHYAAFGPGICVAGHLYHHHSANDE